MKTLTCPAHRYTNPAMRRQTVCAAASCPDTAALYAGAALAASVFALRIMRFSPRHADKAHPTA